MLKFKDSHVAIAVGSMLISSLGFSSMALLNKQLITHVPVWELVFFRTVINFILVLPFVLRSRQPFFPRRGLGLLMARCLAGFGGIAGSFYTVQHLPLSVNALLTWSSPIFVLIFSWLFVKEKLSVWHLFWVSLCFLGMFGVLNPQLSLEQLSIYPISVVGIGLLGAASTGLAYVALRSATKHMSSNHIVVYFMFVSAVFSFLLSSGNFHNIPREFWWQIIAAGVTATIGQVALTFAYSQARASLVGPLSWMTVMMSTALGYIFLNESLRPQQWVGLLVMSIAIVRIIRITSPQEGVL